MADFTLAVVEAAFKVHRMVSSLIISPISIIWKNLSITFMEYSGRVDNAFK